MTEGESEIAFDEQVLQMTCIDPASQDQAAVDEWNRYYTEVHQPDLLRNNPGIQRAYRYELVAPDPSGAFGPRFLALYEWEDLHDARVFVVRGEDTGGSWRPDYLPEPPVWSSLGRGPRQWGRLMCDRIASSGPALAAPAAILIEGIDLPLGADAATVGEFNEFFTEVHSLEITGDVGYSRVTKYQVVDLGQLPPEADHPRYLAIYEANESTVAALGAGLGMPRALPGPSVWESRSTTWRHRYRRISTAVLPGARWTAQLVR